MQYSHWFLLFSALICFFYTVVQWFKVLRDPRDATFAPSDGRPSIASVYSLTLGMSPLKKETAHKHWPTYIAGIGFHMGLFLSLAWLLLLFFDLQIPYGPRFLSSILIAIGAMLGLGILIKRIVMPKMRLISTPDDYFSNLIVTVFMLLTSITLLRPETQSLLMLWAGVLILYIPVGKLRHAVFFIPTRILLGRYFGQRGLWPKARKVR